MNALTVEYSVRLKKLEESKSETIDRLLWSEAHLSRMVSYLLNMKEGILEEDKAETSIWAIGWASKSLLRYLKFDEDDKKYYDRNKFMRQCLDYINQAAKHISEIEIEDNNERKDDILGKIRRAFVDCLDTLLRGNASLPLDIDNMFQTLRELFNKIYSLDGNSADQLRDAIVNKSKIRKEEKKNLSDADFLKYVLGWLYNRKICANDWTPLVEQSPKI